MGILWASKYGPSPPPTKGTRCSYDEDWLKRELTLRGLTGDHLQLQMKLAKGVIHAIKTNMRKWGTTKYGKLDKEGVIRADSWGFHYNRRYIDIRSNAEDQVALRKKCLEQGECFIFIRIPRDEEQVKKYGGRGRNTGKQTKKNTFMRIN